MKLSTFALHQRPLLFGTTFGVFTIFSIKVAQFKESFVCRLPLTCLLFPEKRAEDQMLEVIDTAMDSLGEMREIPELGNTPETRMYGDCS